MANANQNRNCSVYPHVMLHIQARSSLTVTRQIAEIFCTTCCTCNTNVVSTSLSTFKRSLNYRKLSLRFFRNIQSAIRISVPLKSPQRSLKLFREQFPVQYIPSNFSSHMARIIQPQNNKMYNYLSVLRT